MRKMFAALAGFLVLSGCAEIRYAGDRAQSTATREQQLSQNKLSYILDPDRRIINEPPQPIKPGYCYKNFGDIVCYKDPLPNARSRLVGYQEPLERQQEVVGASGYEQIEYRNGDRSKLYNPYRNESGKVDAYVSKEQSFWRQTHGQPAAHSDSTIRPRAKTGSYVGSSALIGKPIFQTENLEPVTVEEQPRVREFKMIDDSPPYCPEACTKKSSKKEVKSKAGKKKLVAKSKAKKSSKAKKVTDKKTSAVQSISAKKEASTLKVKAQAESLVPAKPAAMTPKETLPIVDSPKANLRKLEEIKYDPNAADPKALIKDKN